MMTWNMIVVFMGCLLAVFAVWREYQRTDRSHFVWRIASALLAVIALTGIALPIQYNSTKTGIGKANILLTQGFNRDSLDNNAAIYTLDKSIHQQYPKAKLIYDLDDRFNGAQVYGYGLSPQEITQLKNKSIVFHPSGLPDGIIAANWTQEIKVGQQFRVQGSYQNATTKKYKLILTGSNTPFDSVTIQPKTITQFSLTALPKNNGRMVYDVLAISGNDTLQHEHLPVIVTPIQPLKVLILSASPDFETRFLKSWLTGKGYSVAVRTSITKGKISQDQINIDHIDLNKITTGLLGKFDVMISDLSSINDLATAENAALQQEVLEKGLGLIIRADSSGRKSSWVMHDFTLQQTSKPAIESALLLQGQYKTAKLTIDQQFIKPQNNILSLITDDHQHLLAGVTLAGAGKIIVSTLNRTYVWALAGDQIDHAATWSLLLDKVIRKTSDTAQWHIETKLPTVDRSIQIVTESVDALTDVKVNGLTVYPSQNMAMPFKRQYTYWPSVNGWQQITRQAGQPYWWYVWKDTDWRSLTAANKTTATKQYSNRVALTAKPLMQKIKVNVPKIYFYILFLMVAAFLWIERKFFSL
jgi:hypothetical protein